MRDHRVTLLDGADLKVVLLSKVKTVKLADGDLAMQFNRTLDASAGEGMFQQVTVSLRLAGASTHDLAVSYVVAAPMWKPTYRVVLPKEGKGKALLQGWAVVDNTSGEDWSHVQLGLTSGAPIAFRYDLHTPREVDRAVGEVLRPLARRRRKRNANAQPDRQGTEVAPGLLDEAIVTGHPAALVEDDPAGAGLDLHQRAGEHELASAVGVGRVVL